MGIGKICAGLASERGDVVSYIRNTNEQATTASSGSRLFLPAWVFEASN
jgi:hypothetical protein